MQFNFTKVIDNKRITAMRQKKISMVLQKRHLTI